MRIQLLLAALSTFVAAPLPQQPRDPRLEPFPPPASTYTRKEFRRLVRDMQGGWQLIDVHLPDAETLRRQEVAYLLVSNDLMAIEFHMGFFDEAQFMEESYFQSGIYRMALDERGLLVTSTLIGSTFDEREELMFEPPGTRRSFYASVMGEKLTLVRASDRARFQFEKLATLVELDFYGRRLPEDPEEAAPEKPAPRR